MLRHTFATQYVENGGNLLMLKSILGHSNIKTTEGYVHESKTMLRKDYERAKPRLFV
jgi:site-specific recombinase XerD